MKTTLVQREDRAAARSVSPMLAQPAVSLPKGPQWAYEFKWDGVRAIASIDDGTVRLVGRNGTDLTNRFPELSNRAIPAGGGSLLLDGEIVIVTGSRVDFGRLQRRFHLTQPHRITRLARRWPATYMIFDVLHLEDEDLMHEPLRERRRRLERLSLDKPNWVVSPITSGNGNGDAAEQMVAVARLHELEGVIAKRWDSAYQPGARSGDWVKYRIVKAQEFVVGGWRPSQSGRNDVGALAVGYYIAGHSDKLRFAGFVGSGFTRSDHRLLRELLHEHEQHDNPFDERLPKDDVRFVRPELVVHVRFAQWTDQNILRHPSYKGLRDDKPAAQVVRET